MSFEGIPTLPKQELKNLEPLRGDAVEMGSDLIEQESKLEPRSERGRAWVRALTLCTFLAAGFAGSAQEAEAINLKNLKDSANKALNKVEDIAQDGAQAVGGVVKDGAHAVASVGNGMIDKTNPKHGYPTVEELRERLAKAKTVEEKRAILLEINAEAARKKAEKKNR